MKTFKLFIFLILIMSVSAKSQSITQTLRGKVIDNISQTPIPGVVVMLANTDPVIATATDMDGNFKFANVPVGIQAVIFKYMGYEEQVVPNITLNAGKESVISVNLVEKVVQAKEVTITAEQKKNEALNEMTAVSARTFSVEETQKYAAAVNDPARMASSFAGVVTTEDGNNYIAIRGNSPRGLQYRMEGVDIPNPNHFAAPGSSGGGVSILSAQLLSNSDFLTGAFPAEYGNALSGVFDLRLRKGNNEKREFTVQAGFLGLDVAAEGPFSANSKGSYLINYRYSTLSAIGKIVDLGTGITNFQDISFNFFVPTKKAGYFTVFGFGGLSSYTADAKTDSSEWEESDDNRFGVKFESLISAVGFKHSIILSPKTYLSSSLSYSYENATDKEDRLNDILHKETWIDAHSGAGKATFESILNHKFNSRHSIRSGIVLTRHDFDIRQDVMNTEDHIFEKTIDENGSAFSVQAFTGWSFRVTEKLTLQSGVHFLEFIKNQSASVEPRASVKYQLTEKQSIAFGYGLHSQLQPIGVYFSRNQDATSNVKYPNENIGLSKSHHFVLSYDRMITSNLHVKAETYYQHLFNIPVTSDPAKTFSMVNEIGGYVTEPLTNNGKGENYGLELTVEQFLHNDFYFLLSSSVYDSKYKAANDKWYNTRYNGKYSVAFTSGKEFKSGARYKNRIFGVNVKMIYSGGLKDTPIDIDKSIAQNTTVYFEDKAFTMTNPDYFRTDVRFSMKRNRLHSTHTLSLDVQNVSNRKNVYGSYFNAESGKIKTYYQAPLIPILSYRVEF